MNGESEHKNPVIRIEVEKTMIVFSICGSKVKRKGRKELHLKACVACERVAGENIPMHGECDTWAQQREIATGGELRRT